MSKEAMEIKPPNEKAINNQKKEKTQEKIEHLKREIEDFKFIQHTQHHQYNLQTL